VRTTDVAVLTKIDLAEAVGFDLDATVRNIKRVRADIPILQTSARTDAGLDDWLAWFDAKVLDSLPRHSLVGDGVKTVPQQR
jgi:hydrogenase nickel incorporation protein HypB